MATKDNNSGLLAKVAKFVRNPTKDWSELDQIESEPEAEAEAEKGYTKQVLKEMIERKRRNDFVRRREFDQLRKLRRNVRVINPDQNERPSFFQVSTNTSDLDERAKTIQKIDEIEAQMSKQWWKGKHVAAAADSPQPITSKPPLTDAASSYPNTQPPDSYPDSISGQGSGFAATQPATQGDSEPAPRELVKPMMEFGDLGGKGFDSSTLGLPSSKLFSIELGDSLADPDTEEAAIRFANGDDAGAEAGLLAALRADNVRPESAKGWIAALFDLYRATGRQDSFERVATEYAQRFALSAPAWFSTPDRLGRASTAANLGRAATLSPASQAVWQCPPELDVPALQALRSSLSRSPAPWRLNWGGLVTITPEAGEVLAKLFAEWCTQSVKMHFEGANVLERTLKSCTPSGDKQVDLLWWRLRLDALRTLGLQDEFELAALDFCVTYEVSPPPWEDARCEIVSERLNSTEPAQGADGALGGMAQDHPGSWGQAQTEPMGIEAIPASVVELKGELIGDAAETLRKLAAGLKGIHRLVISCDRLIRVDFSAAGSILNWVAARESEGCHVQFRDVPCLVAAFFNVIGINEHARVLLRNN